jgi:hypothetical protein
LIQPSMVILEDQMLIWSGAHQDSYSQREPTHAQQQNIIIPSSRYALDRPLHHTKGPEREKVARGQGSCC